MIHSYRDMGLKTKIQIIVLSCVLVMAAAGIVGGRAVVETYNEALYESVSHSLLGGSKGLENALDQVDGLADRILSSTAVQEQLPLLPETENREERQLLITQVYNELNNSMFSLNKRFISNISILCGEELISTYTPLDRMLSEDMREGLESMALEAEGTTLWVSEYTEKHGLFLVKELRTAKNLSFDYIGTLVIQIDMEELLAYFSAYEPEYDSCSYGILDGDHALYEGEELKDAGLVDIRNQLKEVYGVVTSGDRKLFAVRALISEYGWEFIAAVSYDSIAETTAGMIRICAAVMALIIILVILFSIRMADSLSSHFKWLIEKMNRFGDGNRALPEDLWDYSARGDEIGSLHRNFNRMAVKINSLIQENYVSEMLKKEAQFKALESQINPHFLHNTLNSITWRAKAIHAEDISLIATSLGNLLHITLDGSDGAFTLGKELEIVTSYMTIQKLRYTRKLEFEMNIPEEFLERPFPRLTLQPLLENAVRYGLEENSDICRITVSGKEEDEKLILEVKNSGSSFEDGLLERLEKGEVIPHGFGIGLLNIQKRLEIAYGKGFGLTLYSEYDEYEEYAVAQITIPAGGEKGGKYAEAADCG